MSRTAAHLRSRSLNIVSLSDMIEGFYRSWDWYTTGQLVDGLQQKKENRFSLNGNGIMSSFLERQFYRFNLYSTNVSLHELYTPEVLMPFQWGIWNRYLYILQRWWGETLLKEESWVWNLTASGSGAPVLEPCEVSNTSSLLLLPAPKWSRRVVPIRAHLWIK